MRSLADLAQTLNLSSTQRRRLPPLVLLTDKGRLPDPIAAVRRLPAGSWVILRHDLKTGLGERLAKLCRAKRLVMLVSGDFSLAVKLGAGLHLPEALARQPSCRVRLWQRRGKGRLTAAAHSREALCRAHRAGADAALLSPVFPTLSHPGAPVLGSLRFRQWVRRAGLPVYALGGITAATGLALQGSGVAGIAAIGGLSPSGP